MACFSSGQLAMGSDLFKEMTDREKYHGLQDKEQGDYRLGANTGRKDRPMNRNLDIDINGIDKNGKENNRNFGFLVGQDTKDISTIREENSPMEPFFCTENRVMERGSERKTVKYTFELGKKDLMLKNEDTSVMNSDDGESIHIAMQPFNQETQLTGRSVLSIQNLDQAEFLFFKMLVLSELLNMPNSLSNSLMHKEPTEMYKRAKNENKGILFYKFQEWIRMDFKNTLDKMQIKTTTKIQVDERHGYKIELQHVSQDADMTMSGFESFDDMASDGVRTKFEAEIDA